MDKHDPNSNIKKIAFLTFLKMRQPIGRSTICMNFIS